MFGSAGSMSNDLNFPFPAAASSSKRGKDDTSADIHHPHHRNHQQQQQHQHHPHHPPSAAEQQQMTSGLLRYRSAPGTLLGEVCEEFLPHRAGSPEAEPMFSRFMVPELRDHFGGGGGEKQGESSSGAGADPAAAASHHGGSGFPSFTQLLFQSSSQQPQPHQQHHHQPLTGLGTASSSDDPYRVVASGGAEQQEMGNKSGGGAGESNLLRQSSSPAFFSHLSSDNGFANPNNRLKSQISFSSRHGSGLVSQLSDAGARSDNNLGSGGSGGSPEESRNGRCFIPGYPVASWEDSVLMNDNFAGAKRNRVDHHTSENGEARGHSGGLVHHLSFPKSSSETEYLQFQDGVPWKLRAKRGCATHPRSIAERVRRTKISERMRKLQELVPNMEKQTNTADMLDLAVEYIRNLQEQIKGMNERRANCTCTGK